VVGAVSLVWRVARLGMAPSLLGAGPVLGTASRGAANLEALWLLPPLWLAQMVVGNQTDLTIDKRPVPYPSGQALE
jgi:hypothetical protein